MTAWIETQLRQLESRFETLLSQFQDLVRQNKAAAQSARTANQQYQTFGTGVGQAVYQAMPTGTVNGASGSFGSLTPVSFTSAVYQVSGAATNAEIASAATVYNWLPATLAANKICYVLPDGQGNWIVISQSCT